MGDFQVACKVGFTGFRVGRLVALLLGLSALGACTSATVPQITHDGLVQQQASNFRELYIRPEASLEEYSEYGLMPCEVAFRKNWARDQNSNRADPSRRITQKHIDQIKDSLAGLCDQYFREALEKEPAYSLVDDFSNGEAVLVLRPRIINLNINAPDTMSAGMSRSYTTSSGEMTLLLELSDATTGEILVRVVDRRLAIDTRQLQWTNGVTNRADAARALRRWADQLRKGLDAATAS